MWRWLKTQLLARAYCHAVTYRSFYENDAKGKKETNKTGKPLAASWRNADLYITCTNRDRRSLCVYIFLLRNEGLLQLVRIARRRSRSWVFPYAVSF